MANTKNSQAAKIRKQIIAWLQDSEQIEVVSTTKFPGIQGIRAVKLRQMLGDQGYVASVVMGAVSAAPSIDHRIKKATLKPREVYYYFDGEPDADSLAAVATPTTAQSPKGVTSATPRTPRRPATPVAGLAGTSAFAALKATNGDLSQRVDDLLTAAQEQAPLSDFEVDFLTDLASQVAKQTELLQNFATQARIAQLRR